MQEADFSEVPEPESYLSIPAGEYRCRIGEVRVATTRDGHERWALRLEVADGDYAGRTAAWDGLVWSERGLPRIKYFLTRLGIQAEGRVRLEPDELLGREIQATLEEEEREDPLSGRRVLRLRVPYLGYERVAGGYGSTGRA
jgi:hypothetical protein